MSAPFYEVLVGRNRFCIDSRYTQLKPAGNGAYGLVASALDAVTGIFYISFVKSNFQYKSGGILCDRESGSD